MSLKAGDKVAHMVVKSNQLLSKQLCLSIIDKINFITVPIVEHKEKRDI